MMHTRSIYIQRVLLAVLFVSFIVVIRQDMLTPPPTPTERVLALALLHREDLSGWRLVGSETASARHGVASSRRFERARDKPWINVQQHVFLFENLETATAYYESPEVTLLARGIPLSDLAVGSHEADAMHGTCLPGTTTDGEGYHICDVVARYGTLVTIIRTTVFEHSWQNHSDFEKLLFNVDRRMREAQRLDAMLQTP